METNVIIIGISLLVIIVILLVLYLVYLFKYTKLRKEYYEYKRSVLKKNNRLSMVEYYLRKHKEKNGNVYTTFRDIEETVYYNRDN